MSIVSLLSRVNPTLLRQITLLSISYALAGHLALSLAIAPGFVSPLWPSAGIALAALLLRGSQLWPGIFVGSLLVNVPRLGSSGDFHWGLIPTAIAIGAGATLQALAGYKGLKHVRLANRESFTTPSFIASLAGIGMMSVLINSFIGTLTLAVGNYIPWELSDVTFITWYLGDLAGIIIATPLILVWAIKQPDLFGGRRSEGAAVFFILTVLSFLVFYGWGMNPDPKFGGTFLILPILAWSALRFGPRGATASLVLVLSFALHATYIGYGPFYLDPQNRNHSLLLLGLFAAVTSGMTLILATQKTRQRTAELLLYQSHNELEKTVEERTSQLRESELRFRTLFENSPDIVLVHQNQIISLANPTAARLFTGGSITDLQGHNVLDFVHPDYKEIAARRIAGLAQEGATVPWLEEKLLALDGTVIDVEVVGSHISLGGRSAVQVVAHDIRERKRAESALRESEAKFRRIVETSVEGIWTLDAAAKTEFVNSRLAEMLGYSAEELHGRNFVDFLYSPDSFSVNRIISRLKSGKREHYDIQLRRKDGSKLWVIVSASPLVDANGSIIGILKMLTDITERKRYAERLEETNSLLHAAFEATADGILVTDRGGKITSFNQKFLGMWRVPESIVGNENRMLNFIANQLCKPHQFIEKMRNVDNEEEDNLDVLTFNDGRIYEGVSIPQLIDRQVAGRVWSFRDATSRLHAESERNELLDRERNSREAAERALHGREEFLSVASHELKTPITSLLFAVQNLDNMLAMKQNEDPLLANALGVAERQTRRLAGLVNALLDITRIQSGSLRLEKSETNLKQLLAQVLDELQQEIRRSGCTVTVKAPENIIGYWDTFRIEQVLTNLITNAIKYGAGKPVEITLWNDLESAFITVSDHGMGIRPEDRNRIFEPFERAASSRNFSGLGLGLAIVRSIVTGHAGTIDFESEPGVGSTFRIQLPLRQAVH